MIERVAAAIPALDAQATVGRVAREALTEVGTVVVVDDGSADATSREAQEAGALVIRHQRNRGKGAALKTAFAWALEHAFDGVVTIDADGQHLPSEIGRILQARRETGADLVIGGRAHLFDGMLPRRRLANRFSAWSISHAAGVNVDDSQSGFRFYSARLLRALPLRSDGFAMESEVIVRAGRAGFGIVTTPIALGFVDGIATSHYRPLVDTLRIASTVLLARFVWK